MNWGQPQTICEWQERYLKTEVFRANILMQKKWSWRPRWAPCSFLTAQFYLEDFIGSISSFHTVPFPSSRCHLPLLLSGTTTVESWVPLRNCKIWCSIESTLDTLRLDHSKTSSDTMAKQFAAKGIRNRETPSFWVPEIIKPKNTTAYKVEVWIPILFRLQVFFCV